MSRLQKPLKSFWDKTVQTNNKLTVTNRFARVVQHIQEEYDISEGKAIEGLINKTYSYDDILKEVRKYNHDI